MTESHPATPAINPRAILGVLGALTAFGPLSIDMYLPALPTIQRDLATSPSATQRTLSAYFLGLAISQLVYGPMSDRFGRRKPLFFWLSLYLLSSGVAHLPALAARRGPRDLPPRGHAT